VTDFGYTRYMRNYMREYRAKHRKKYNAQKLVWTKQNPWKKTLTNIRQRCQNKRNSMYRWYGGKGIKVCITAGELKYLWLRDKAFRMLRPSIDRIDSNKNYTQRNCRYIEQHENLCRRYL